ncbi:hypothetical protein J2W71_004516 [Pseudomonas sp. 3400]|nr:hypothetical protein [Pseudomonas sp. 3400]MDR7014279.1 hypothetical protein [Pseudomonas alcaliphila]
MKIFYNLPRSNEPNNWLKPFASLTLTSVSCSSGRPLAKLQV